MEYDWRSRFGLGADAIGDEMSSAEAIRLVRILLADPSSMLTAATQGWEYPISRAEVVALDTFDLLLAVNSTRKGRPEPHPLRPWKQDKKLRQRHGDAAGRSLEQVRAILNDHGHSLPPV